MFKIIKKKLAILIEKYNLFIFFVLSLGPLFWYRKIRHLFTFIGRGDYLSPVNVDKLLTSDFFTINWSFGGLGNSANLGHFIPSNLWFYVFYKYLHLNPIITSLFFISFIIFLSLVSFNLFLRYFSSKQESNSLSQPKRNLINILSSIIYAYSPFVLALIAPGHIILLFNYALFPLILKYVDVLFNREKVQKKDTFPLFLIFLFCSSSFANIGIIYVNVIIITSYSILIYILNKKQFTDVLKKNMLIFSVLFLSNSWWLISYIYEIFSNRLVFLGNSASIIKQYLIKPDVNAFYMLKTLFGINMFNYVVSEKNLIFNLGNYLSMTFMLYFFIKSVTTSVFKKNISIPVFLALAVLVIFLSKNNTGPFSFIFTFMFYKIPGFVSFRNSANKFYWLYWLILVFFSTIGLQIILNGKNYFKIITLFLFIPLFYILTFIKHPQLNVFNIPNYYKDVNKYFLKKNSSRILVLPSFDGDAPYYGTDVNYYHGSDFIPQIWDFNIVVPGSMNYDLETPHKKVVEKIYSHIIKGMPICEDLKKLGISDIAVLKDLNNYRMSPPTSLLKKLSAMNSVEEITSFGKVNENGIVVFHVNKECSKNIVSLRDNSSSSIDYEIVNPTKIKIQINNYLDNEQIHLILNNDSNWVLSVNKYRNNYLDYAKANLNHLTNKRTSFADLWVDVNDLVVKNKLIKKEFSSASTYSNNWIIRNQDILNLGKEYYQTNSHNSKSIQLTLNYRSQLIRFVSIVIFLLVFIIYLVYVSI